MNSVASSTAKLVVAARFPRAGRGIAARWFSGDDFSADDYRARNSRPAFGRDDATEIHATSRRNPQLENGAPSPPPPPDEEFLQSTSVGREAPVEYEERIPMETLFQLPLDTARDGAEDRRRNTRGGSRSKRQKKYYEDLLLETDRIFKILTEDGLGFNARHMLDELSVCISHDLVRHVLLRILCSINASNKLSCSKLAYKFFSWSAQQDGYRHNTNMYNLTLRIFAECDEIKVMWRLFEEMTELGLPVTARTLNILICTCGRAGLARRVVERFIRSRKFNYRPFKNAFNAILYSLLTINQYQLIEWVHEKMNEEGHAPDILTYNVVMRAKYLLGKIDEFHRLVDEMARNEFLPDLHTYNILLHVLGRGDKPVAAVKLLDYMTEVGCTPCLIHFTNLIDGLSRAGNLEACRYFFDEMIKKGFEPDVVCYTVMITGHLLAGELERGQELFRDMVNRGQLPNVYTYNSMIRGLCDAGRFREACSLLKDMHSRGCTPNFSVYSTLVTQLRKAGKSTEVNNILSYMVEKGHYLHMMSMFKGYKRT